VKRAVNGGSGAGDNLHSMFEGKHGSGSIRHISQTNLFRLPYARETWNPGYGNAILRAQTSANGC